MEKELGKKNDRYVALSNDVQNSELVLAHMKDTVLTGLVQDYDAKKKTRANLESLRADVESKFRTLSSVKREYDAFQKDLAKDEVEYSRYHDMSDKLTTGSADGFDPVVVEERAQQPLAPFRPDKQLNIILGIVFGLLSGVGLAFFLEYLDDTVKTKEELQRITDVPLFGVIPNIAARRGDSSKRDLYAYQQPKSTISEAFRGIRTAISYSSQKRENRVYLVTSAGPKEGKTTVAINVATVMAYSGTKTVIVDADLRKPRVHKSFELENVRGLTNLIIGDASVEDVVQPTSIENLYVLPSGPIPPNPSELLGRERMIQILEELRGRYDRILLDTPPIGAVTDAAVLGRIVDSVILVVHAGKTRKKLIERGLEQLAQIDVDVSGIVLNNLKIGRKRYYPGYYHYYYYYSSYYGSDEPSKSVGKNKQKV
jgi:capsular exopolysaccharide synthesis family protein